MLRPHGILVCFAVVFGSTSVAWAQRKPAPSPSRYGYTLRIEAEALPKGVTVRETREGGPPRWFIANTGETPLVINERFQNGALVSGAKLVGGLVYHYFPSGVPMEGKTHLKGWQAPFGDIKETLLTLDKEPPQIYEGRRPGLSKELPPPEKVTIPAKFGDKPFAIPAVVEFHHNDAYDEFHRDAGR